MTNSRLITRRRRTCSRRTYQTHHEDFHVHMSEEEKIAAEESLKAYGKTIELDNILQHRAKKNPLFLQRSLSYQIEAKHQRRIQMTVSLSDTQKLFPIYVLLARLVSPKPTAECSAVYKFSRACILTGVLGVDGVSQAQAKFLLPDMNELALEAKSGSLAILFISFGGNCLWSNIPLESIYSSWQKYPNMDLEQKANSVSLVEMQPCSVQIKSMSEEKCIAIQVPSNPLTSSSPQQMKVTISAEEVAPTEKSPYNSLSFNDVPSSSMLEIIRSRAGNVIFNYIYYNNKLQKTE
ncbi:polycomb group protein EMBRYONIC FLOWER 2-like, partial [Raphanus sativus]|uniref:Polycomb group protein EMBRYONIC FLOWER 2-like n=1 Tax=Raphanus sativus TaxID=3726 RepID=A0A9W3CUE4_RAPSA